MKRQVIACFYMCVTSFLVAGNATIDEVVTFERGEKTSVVITYSGVEKLRFFALDSTDGIFTLDFPGVYSHFDFSSLAFPQVKSVEQGPLDPDVSNGISVRFFLHDGVSYDVFESGKNTLTLFFEGGIPDEVEAVASVEPVAPAVPDASAPVAPPVNNIQKSLTGDKGTGRLYEVAVDASAVGGKLFLSVDQVGKYSHFFLDNPKRFVLDMRDTVLSLKANDLVMDHPLVSQVRIRQFQSHPNPITRAVLDLSADTHVSVLPEDRGLMVVFAQDTASLSALLDEAEQTTAVAGETEDSEPVGSEFTSEATESIADSSIPTEENLVESTPEQVASNEADMEDVIEETSPESSHNELVETPQVVANTEPVTPLAEPTLVESLPEVESEPVVEDAQTMTIAESDADDAPNTSHAEANVAEPSIEDETRQSESAAIVVANTSDIPSSADPERGDDLTEESVVLEADAAVAEAPVDESVSSDMAEEPIETQAAERAISDEDVVSETPFVAEVSEPAAQSQATQQSRNTYQVVRAEASADEELASFEEDSGTSDFTPIAESKDLTDPTDIAAVDDEEPQALRPGADGNSGIEDPLLLEASQESPFVMASDIDLEMEDALKETRKNESLYHQMKGIKSNRRHADKVRITNDRIAASKVLAESSNMQDEGEDGEFDDLFEEEEDPFQSVGEEVPKYRGFEIMIDIRDQPVLDLLRFLADEVGFNLYVDSSVEEITATYKFRNIPWDQALDIILTNANLAKEFRNGVLRVATTEQFKKEELARAELRQQRELSVPTDTVTVDLNYARARDIVPIVTEYLSPRGSIIRDDRTNILIIRDIPKYMVDIRTLINRLDKRIPQVSIEARIVETTTRFLRELGIQWGLTAQYSPETGTDTGVDFPHRVTLGGPTIGLPRNFVTGPEGGYAVNLPAVSENVSGFGLTLGNFLDNFKLDVSMQMLETEGQGQIISSPKVTTQNNRTAVITNGQRVPIQTIQRGTVTTRYIDAVLELQVTPQITADETIIMDLIVDKSEPDFTRASGAGGNPIINVSRAETQVLVKNGGTAVIGGIFSLNEQVSEQGLPGLRKIPVLKRMFASENKQYNNQELLIFVTPKIVKY